jgi:NitT/TauT family transport system substrate-binding protein
VVPGIDNAPLTVAVIHGMFQAHGLNVTVKDYLSLGPEIKALTSGQLDIAAGDYADFFYEEANGLNLHLIADGYDATSNLMEVLTLPGSNITSPLDLATSGKYVATPEPQVIPTTPNFIVPYSMETLATEAVLQSDGVSPSSVKWKPTPIPEMLGELSSGKVGAILVPEPYVYEAEAKLGAVEVMDSCSGVTANLPLSGYFSLARYASANPSAVQAFQAALSQAQSDAAMRGPVQAVLPKLAGITPDEAAMVTLGTYPTFLSVGQVQRVANLMYDSGVIPTPINVGSLASG